MHFRSLLYAITYKYPLFFFLNDVPLLCRELRKKKTLPVIIVGHQKCKMIPISEKFKCEGGDMHLRTARLN